MSASSACSTASPRPVAWRGHSSPPRYWARSGRARNWPRAKLLNEAARLVQRFQPLRREEPRVGLVLANGVGPLSRGGECRDQPVLRLVVRWIGRRPAVGDGDRTGEVARRKLRGEQVGTCLAEESRVPGPASIDPTLPRLQVDEMHTVEKRPAVEPHGALTVSKLQRVAECARIRRARAAHNELVDARIDPVVPADGLSEVIEALPECVARVLRVTLGPEHRRQRLTRDAALNR